MFPLAAWRFLSVIVSFPLSIASTAKLISVDSFTAVSFACFSARSFVNFSSEDSKPLMSINVMFSIRVHVLIRSAAGLIGSQDAYTKVKFSKQGKLRSYRNLRVRKTSRNRNGYSSQNTLYSNIQLLCCTLAFFSGLTTKFVFFGTKSESAFFRDEVEHL